MDHAQDVTLSESGDQDPINIEGSCFIPLLDGLVHYCEYAPTRQTSLPAFWAKLTLCSVLCDTGFNQS